MNPKSAWRALGIACSHYSPKIVAFVGLFFPFRQAEGLYRRALEGGESQLGAQHPDTLVWVHNLADLLYKQGKLEEAGPRSLGCREVAFLALSRGRHFPCGQDETGQDGWIVFPSFTGAIWECELMPRLMYGQILIWVWWGNISRQREPFEIECWTACLLVNLLWNYWVNHQRHGPSKSEGLFSPWTEFIMFCEWFWWSSKADCGEFPQFLTGAWNSIFILIKVQEVWPSLTFTLSHKSAMKPGTWSSSHVSLSAPSRAARQKGCTAEPWKA